MILRLNAEFRQLLPNRSGGKNQRSSVCYPQLVSVEAVIVQSLDSILIGFMYIYMEFSR